MSSVLETTCTHRISILSARRNALLVRQLQQADCITKDIVISKVPCEIRDLHYTREMKGKGKVQVEKAVRENKQRP